MRVMGAPSLQLCSTVCGRAKVMTLTIDSSSAASSSTCCQRFHRIRHYGLLANGGRAEKSREPTVLASRRHRASPPMPTPTSRRCSVIHARAAAAL